MMTSIPWKPEDPCARWEWIHRTSCDYAYHPYWWVMFSPVATLPVSVVDINEAFGFAYLQFYSPVNNSFYCFQAVR